MPPNSHLSLDPSRFNDLADSLGDTPQTTIPVHRLRHRMCKVYLAGQPQNFSAAIIQQDPVPDEPMGFGTDPESMWQLLQEVEGWYCVNVAARIAEPLGRIMQKALGHPMKHYGDVYHILRGPPPQQTHPHVRQLTADDLPLLEAAPKHLRPDGYKNLDTALLEGVIASPIVDGRIVGIAHTNARTAQHGDIGVRTGEGFRGRGYATAAAAIVARNLIEAGQAPVWSAGETNAASLCIAQKLGFTQIFRRVYLTAKKRDHS